MRLSKNEIVKVRRRLNIEEYVDKVRDILYKVRREGDKAIIDGSSEIGPYTIIGQGSVVKKSKIDSSLIMSDVLIEKSVAYMIERDIAYLNYLTMQNRKQNSLSSFKYRVGFREYSLAVLQ